MAIENVMNFRDVGEWINLILGKETLKPDTLYRGGSIRTCFSQDEIRNPDAIVCLKRSIDKPNWGGVLHYPTPNTLDCYECDRWQVRHWISSVVNGLSEALPRKTYIHCHSGRDRTGVVVAAILLSLDIPKGVIEEEYALSSGCVPALFKSALERQEDASWIPLKDRMALRELFASQSA